MIVQRLGHAAKGIGGLGGAAVRIVRRGAGRDHRVPGGRFGDQITGRAADHDVHILNSLGRVDLPQRIVMGMGAPYLRRTGAL